MNVLNISKALEQNKLVTEAIIWDNNYNNPFGEYD